jgi:drug/metabolite transporter (DMT)-like permease
VSPPAKASTAQLAVAFATVYLVWGSTYLGIRLAGETIPPLFMAGVRFSIAGCVLLAYSLATKPAKPTRAEYVNAAIAGCLMLCFGNGALSWAEQRVPSGLAALIVACVPLWLLLLNWASKRRMKPTASQLCGLAIGLVGMAVLVFPSGAALGKNVDPVGAGVILFGSFCWAFGTMQARNTKLPPNPWLNNGVQMVSAGLLLLVLSPCLGERGLGAHVSRSSLYALGYLVVFGSIVAFTAYTWLNQHTTPARLGTYAFVNPVVAVLIGSAFAGEQITLRAVLAMTLILAAVVLLSLQKRQVVDQPEQVAA